MRVERTPYRPSAPVAAAIHQMRNPATGLIDASATEVRHAAPQPPHADPSAPAVRESRRRQPRPDMDIDALLRRLAGYCDPLVRDWAARLLDGNATGGGVPLSPHRGHAPVQRNPGQNVCRPSRRAPVRPN
jgi:hypothetical protein